MVCGCSTPISLQLLFFVVRSEARGVVLPVLAARSLRRASSSIMHDFHARTRAESLATPLPPRSSTNRSLFVAEGTAFFSSAAPTACDHRTRCSTLSPYARVLHPPRATALCRVLPLYPLILRTAHCSPPPCPSLASGTRVVFANYTCSFCESSIQAHTQKNYAYISIHYTYT